MQKTEFVALMSKLRACYQNAISDPDMWGASVNQYWEVLKGCGDDRLRQAFDAAWRKHPDWMPSLGQLADLVGSGGAGVKQKAVEAWPEVMKLATRSKGDHSDPIAAEAIRLMGGGKQLGQRNLDELEKWGRKEFVDLYEEIATRARPLPDALPPWMPTNLMGAPDG